jgi:hypothetical protein
VQAGQSQQQASVVCAAARSAFFIVVTLGRSGVELVVEAHAGNGPGRGRAVVVECAVVERADDGAAGVVRRAVGPARRLARLDESGEGAAEREELPDPVVDVPTLAAATSRAASAAAGRRASARRRTSSSTSASVKPSAWARLMNRTRAAASGGYSRYPLARRPVGRSSPRRS